MRAASYIYLPVEGGSSEEMAKSSAEGLLCRFQLSSRQLHSHLRNAVDSIKVLDVGGFRGPLSPTRCMVDLLGRAGLLEEAKLLIDEMLIEPDAVIWTTLLGAYGNVELGELAAKEVFKLDPYLPSAYVHLSNIYAAAGEWDEQESVRYMMEERGVRKEPGRSWIEVDEKIHEFGVADFSHPEAKAIYSMLNKLTETLKAEGYTPNIRLC